MRQGKERERRGGGERKMGRGEERERRREREWGREGGREIVTRQASRHTCFHLAQ